MCQLIFVICCVMYKQILVVMLCFFRCKSLECNHPLILATCFQQLFNGFATKNYDINLILTIYGSQSHWKFPQENFWQPKSLEYFAKNIAGDPMPQKTSLGKFLAFDAIGNFPRKISWGLWPPANFLAGFVHRQLSLKKCFSGYAH